METLDYHGQNGTNDPVTLRVKNDNDKIPDNYAEQSIAMWE